jgi:NADH-quinone oxidoreductase subunit D
MDTGAMTVFLYTFQQREIIYNLMEQITGARFTTSYTRIGGMVRDINDRIISDVRKFCEGVLPVVDETDKLLTRNRIFVDRTKDIGTITKEDAISYGLSGPNLRGSGVDHDLRKRQPYCGYEQYDFDVPLGSVGDSYDRYLVRMEEIKQSVRILRQVCDTMPGGAWHVNDPKNYPPPKTTVLTKMEELIHHFLIHTEGLKAPEGEVYFGAENPKGELGFYIFSKGGGTPYRLKIRSPSFINLSILPKILPGHMMSDVVSILGSLDFVMGECDR